MSTSTKRKPKPKPKSKPRRADDLKQHCGDRGKMPSIRQIIAAWSRERDAPWLSFEDKCWACGNWGGGVERAHIIPHSGGGSMEPLNFFLLCGACHRAQPDNAPREFQIAWLRTVSPWVVKVQSMAAALLAELHKVGGDAAVEMGNQLLQDKETVSAIFEESKKRTMVSGGHHISNKIASGQWNMMGIVVEMVRDAMTPPPMADAPSLAAAEQMELLS
jgi:5-methylcytosine-specific restriction endonuclease McrA